MRWIATVSLFLVLASSVLAAGSDEQYLDIYNEILQADSLQASGQQEAAALRYLQAQTDLQKLQTEHSNWNPDIVKFRLDYLSDKLQALAKFLPSTNSAPAAAPAAAAGTQATPAAPASVGPSIADLQQQSAGYQEQIRSLTAVNSELEGKLKEALSVQPAAVSPAEMEKAQAKISSLQKERDLLAVALEQEKANTSNAVAEAKAAALSDAKAQSDEDAKKAMVELTAAKAAAAASEAKLAEATKELDELKAARAADAEAAAALKARADESEKNTQQEVARLRDASAESDKILAAATKELELLKQAGAGTTPATTPSIAPTAAGEGPDQLKQAMAEISADETQIAQLKDAVADAEKKYAAANSELVALKSAPPAAQAANAPAADTNATAAPAAADTSAITAERDKLKEELAERSKDLADVEAHHNEELVNLRTELKEAQDRRDELEKQLAAAPPISQPAQPAPAAPRGSAAQTAPTDNAAAQQLEKLQARIAILEADPVPYTSEELAILKLPAPATPAEPPKPPAGTKPLHSIKDLPPGSGTLWSDALRATMDHNYDDAEKKFNEVLQQDPTNVYVLAYLANAQFAAGHLAECEKSVLRALAVESDDPGSLYLLGVLRYRQNRLDDALDALSRSAKYNPTNSATQNFLGCVLADKGLRPAAETALRKALQTDPDYAEAHFNLAVVYIGNQPPSVELARWHYKKAVALGHPKSDMLEKMLTETADGSGSAGTSANASSSTTPAGH